MPNQFTRNYGLTKPDFNLVTWHDLVNGNFDLLDSILFALSGISGFVGVWTNATNYSIGERVMDGNDATIWQCMVNHTSAASGTMEDDRTANPTFWNPITSVFTSTGEWENDFHFNVGDVAYHTVDGLFGIANTEHTSSSAPDTMRDDIANWDILFDSSFIANATNIGFTPAGTIAAVNVQTAIQELDSENQAAHTTLQNNINGKVSLGNTSYLTPTGVVIDYAGAAPAPSGWILCGGQAVSRITEAALFTVIGTTYGAGDGVNTFNVPDVQDRVTIGKGNMSGVAVNRITAAISGINTSNLGAGGGFQSVVLALANLPNVNLNIAGLGVVVTDPGHIHSIDGIRNNTGDNDFNIASGANNHQTISDSGSATTGISADVNGTLPLGGSATAFSIVQPGIVFNKIIKN